MPNICHEILIRATPEEILEALSTQTGLANWWTPKAEVHEHVLKFPFGDNYFKQMEVIESALELVKWNCVFGADEWIGTQISFRIQSAKSETISIEFPEIGDQFSQAQGPNEFSILEFRHENWKSESRMFAECNYTWGRFLTSLKLYCETGNGTPWPHQHGSSTALGT